jgi:hypothetical protein
MEQWEYKVIMVFGLAKDVETSLNNLGNQGWEAVNIQLFEPDLKQASVRPSEGNGKYQATLKRRKP